MRTRMIGARSAGLATATAGVLLLGAVWAPTALGANDEATIYVVQGLPDERVDISLGGERVAQDIATAEIVGPFSVDAGATEVEFVGAKGDEVARTTVETEAGTNSDVVVHLNSSASNEAVTTIFANDLTPVQMGKASVSVAHTAAVPPTDILVDGEVLFANVANGESLNLVVPASTYEVSVVPTGETDPMILGPLDLELTAGSRCRVYAVGDPESSSMEVAVHINDVPTSGSPAPRMVNTGTGGQAAGLFDLRMVLTGLLW